MSDEREEQRQLEELEAAMRQMPLRQPSRQLDLRIGTALAERTSGARVAGYIGAALAAAAAVLIALWPQTPAEPTENLPTMADVRTPSPVVTQNGQYTVTNSTEQWLDDGVVDYTADGPVRQYRLVIEQYASGNDRTPTIRNEEIVQVIARPY